MDELEAVRAYLSIVCQREPNSDNDDKVKEILSALKGQAVACDDQMRAKEIWCYEQILAIQQSYLSSFDLMKTEQYYAAWCILERTEIQLHHLERHYSYAGYDYRLWFINKHLRQFQSLYPYAIFMSPAYVKKKVLCSICRKAISIRNPCGHIVGEIYNGEQCGREVVEAELLEISATTEPSQKYSVGFIVDSETGEKTDHYNYSLVKYVISGLRSPFDGWDVTWMNKRHPHVRYVHVNPAEACPCESGNKYSDCCLPTDGVLRPHAQISFWIPPPADLPSLVYSD